MSGNIYEHYAASDLETTHIKLLWNLELKCPAVQTEGCFLCGIELQFFSYYSNGWLDVTCSFQDRAKTSLPAEIEMFSSVPSFIVCFSWLYFELIFFLCVCLQQHFVSQPSGGSATTTELDMCVGNMLVLLQLELGDTEQPMPGALDLLTKLMSHIRSRSSFSYPIFTNYIINSDILEEVMHLATKQGGLVAFEIAPPSSTQLARYLFLITGSV